MPTLKRTPTLAFALMPTLLGLLVLAFLPPARQVPQSCQAAPIPRTLTDTAQFTIHLPLAICQPPATPTPVPTPTAQPTPSPSIAELRNGEFEGNWCRETHDGHQYPEVYVPEHWIAYWSEEDTVPHDPHNSLGYVRPEMKVINRQPPFLDPPRINSGDRAYQYFKQWAIYDAGLYQTITGLMSGDRLELSGWAHAWSANGSHDGADCSEGENVGCGPFYALEGSGGLDDAARNFTFHLGIDPTGGTDPWSSTVVWGQGAHIYNAYAPVPPVAVAADGPTVTVFLRSQVLWPFRNCDSYWDDIRLGIDPK